MTAPGMLWLELENRQRGILTGSGPPPTFMDNAILLRMELLEETGSVAMGPRMALTKLGREVSAFGLEARRIASELPRAQREWLVGILDMNRNGITGLGSNRLYRKRDAEALVATGLANGRSMVAVDGDGFTIEPERYRTAYELTEPLGKAVALILDAASEGEVWATPP